VAAVASAPAAAATAIAGEVTVLVADQRAPVAVVVDRHGRWMPPVFFLLVWVWDWDVFGIAPCLWRLIYSRHGEDVMYVWGA
jgi:hypothetical protein